MPRPTLLVAAFSARQIARSAHAAGYDVLAVDFFNDNDLAAYCVDCAALAGHFPDGFPADALLETLHRLAGNRQPEGFVYGAGFEDRPELLATIAKSWPVFGNSAATVRRLKDPANFAAICKLAGIPHPETQMEKPVDPAGWLAKQVGGAGGGHVVHAENVQEAVNCYFQRQLAGARYSLGFIGYGHAIESFGITQQWCSPVPEAPYRYGGAVGPLPMPELEQQLVALVERFLEHLPLHGICSADFIVPAHGDAVMLEINPRPGATLDVHDTASDPLLAHHIAACTGMRRAAPQRPEPCASGLAWADQAGTIGPDVSWPHWAADLPLANTAIASGEPVCTIIVNAADCRGNADAAMELLQFREGLVLGNLRRDAA